jgi:putative alpha-1,2-mannosidase
MFTFGAKVTSVSSRVGISWISIEKARQNVDREIPAGTALQKVVQDTKCAWNKEVLSKITITSDSTENLQLLYTSLYFMNLLPTNQTDENPGWTSTEPYYSDIFTLWDLFRCSTSLLHIIQPRVYEEYIRSLIDIWRHDGYLPDARSSNYNGRTQVGSNADNVLADAFVKGVRGKINWNDGYAAMVKDAEVAPPNSVPPDPQGPDASTKEGRGALLDWLEHGFITKSIYTRSVSRAVEYAYNDFSLYQVAKGLGNTDDETKYLNRSRNWRNHWNADLESLGFSGFVAPRNLTDFLPITPLEDRGYWGGAFYEGGSWDYSWTDVHDMNKIIELMGGTSRTLARLETMFQVGADPANPNGTIFDGSNEP